jgi:transcriptional regulator with XRE-family HTH domain
VSSAWLTEADALEALAKRAKVAQGYISEVEAGTKGRRPGVSVLQRLARALDVAVSDFVR